jgi:prevent-host-death family protein
MQKVGSRELKNRLGRYLSAVRKGQSLLITDRGRTVAKLSPPDPQEEQEKDQTLQVLESLEKQGLIKIGRKPFRKIRPLRGRGGKSASEMIIEDRR